VGALLHELKTFFKRIYTIEIVPELTARAKAYIGPEITHITYIIGDSGVKLGNVMKKIDEPTMFYLDGHYSGPGTGRGDKDTPILEELSCILSAPDLGHVIIIDNANGFVRAVKDYPSLPELERFVYLFRDNVDITVESDQIIIVPTKRHDQLKALWKLWEKECV